MSDSPSESGISERALTVSVVSHTHWDREWYHSAGRFRQQLVALVEALLDESNTGSRPFLLDGQAIVLEDYLAVRPEQSALLGAFLVDGAIEAGPWYVLADGLIPSGEAVVRNLQTGLRVLRRLGASAPPVAYCPDTFGHSHAIPTIAEGFGFRLAITWRGYGGPRTAFGDTVRWRSDNGAEVLMYHLPPDGYETGSSLPIDRDAVRRRWEQLRETIVARSNTGVVLVPNGADHHALQPDIAEAIDALRRAATPAAIVRESLGAFASRLVQAATGKLDALPVVQGELRDSYGYTWTLGGTLGTRAAQKRANAKAERALLRDVEPWLVLGWIHNGPKVEQVSRSAIITLAQAPALLDAAWRTLLRAHPHDTLCGCSIDAVARAMDARLESVALQSRGLRRAAFNLALGRNPVTARSRAIGDPSHVVVRNRCPYWRGGVAEILIDETLRDVSVGPGSADLSNTGDESRNLHDARTRAEGMLPWPAQHVRSRDVFRRRESPQHYPDNDLVREHRVLVWVPPIAPLGLSVQSVGQPASEQRRVTIPNPVVLTHESESSAEFSNGLVAVRADSSGVNISYRRRMNSRHENVQPTNDGTAMREALVMRSIVNAITFETRGDVGDSYTPAIRGEPELLKITSVRVALRGPMRGSIELRAQTGGKRKRVRVRATISLDANAEYLRLDILGNNQRRNHRLRVNFHTDVSRNAQNIETRADAAFGPVARPPIVVSREHQAREMVPPTMPMHRWASMTNSHIGATLHSDGLAEVECSEASGTMSLTLLRAIGELSRNNLPERPGHAGWPSPIPQAQSIGAFHSRIGLQLHGGWSQDTRDAIENVSDAILLPLVGETERDLREPERTIAGPQLVGTALRFSAATLADDGDGIVLRCVNDSGSEQIGAWVLPVGPLREHVLARIDETPLGDWQASSGPVQFTAPPRGVVTLRVRRRAH